MELKLKMGDKEFVSVNYWWEGQNFFFVTLDGEKYCCENCYPTALTFDGLDSNSSDLVTIQNNVRYIPSGQHGKD